jgi:hypothetical protein
LATLTGKKIKNTYDALLKIDDNDSVTSTAKQITDGLGNTTPLYLSTTQLGIGVSPSFQLHTSSDAKIGGNLTVSGNLTVDGTTTIIDSTIVAIGDNMIELAKDNIANTKKLVLLHYYLRHNKFQHILCHFLLLYHTNLYLSY